jgi:hypothetical protein
MLAVASSTRGGLSVGTVCSQTKATEFSLGIYNICIMLGVELKPRALEHVTVMAYELIIHSDCVIKLIRQSGGHCSVHYTKSDRASEYSASSRKISSLARLFEVSPLRFTLTMPFVSESECMFSAGQRILFFLNSFISNQNYSRFYKLIC